MFFQFPKNFYFISRFSKKIVNFMRSFHPALISIPQLPHWLKYWQKLPPNEDARSFTKSKDKASKYRKILRNFHTSQNIGQMYDTSKDRRFESKVKGYSISSFSKVYAYSTRISTNLSINFMYQYQRAIRILLFLVNL